MKRFLETLAVFLGSMLEVRARSWQDSQKEVAKMHEQIENWDDNAACLVDCAGVVFEPVPPESPFSYLGRTTLVALGFVGLLWVTFQLVLGFLAALPVLLIVAFLAWLLSVYGTPSTDVRAA